jgi:predicted permease
VVILDTLAPVFLLVALGAWLQRSGFVPAEFLKESNRLTYRVGLPALLFVELAPALPSATGVKPALAALLAATLLVVGCAYLAACVWRLPGSRMGTFVQGAYRGNLVFVGLPIVFALPDAPVAGGLTLHRAAVVVIAPVMLLYNVMAVVVLLAGQHRLRWAMLRPMLKQLAVTPPFVAIVAGLLVAAAGWRVPVPINGALRALGEMTLPLGLLGVGGSLVTIRLSGGWRLPGGAALLKSVVSPAIGWACGRWWGLDPMMLKAVMIFMAAPTAIASYAMALELKGDEQLASGVIATSVFTSLGVLAVIVGCF